MTLMHADDEFHPPLDNDPYRTETCWFTFTVPERRLSGQFYPFFLPNLGVFAGAAYFWNDEGDQWWNCLYAKNFWHLPIPQAPLSNIELPNGLRLRCLEPLTRYDIAYRDPDGNDEVEVDLTFTAIAPCAWRAPFWRHLGPPCHDGVAHWCRAHGLGRCVAATRPVDGGAGTCLPTG